MHLFQCCIAVSLLPNHCSGFTGSCSAAVTRWHHCHQCWSVTNWQHVTTAASCQRCHHTVTVTVHWSLITVMLNLQKVMQNLLLLPLDLAGSPCKTEAAESPTGFVWKRVRVPLNPLVKQHVPHQGCNFGVYSTACSSIFRPTSKVVLPSESLNGCPKRYNKETLRLLLCALGKARHSGWGPDFINQGDDSDKHKRQSTKSLGNLMPRTRIEIQQISASSIT